MHFLISVRLVERWLTFCSLASILGIHLKLNLYSQNYIYNVYWSCSIKKFYLFFVFCLTHSSNRIALNSECHSSLWLITMTLISSPDCPTNNTITAYLRHLFSTFNNTIDSVVLDLFECVCCHWSAIDHNWRCVTQFKNNFTIALNAFGFANQ